MAQFYTWTSYLKNEVQKVHFLACAEKPAFFNFAPLASPACGELGTPVCVSIQGTTRALHQKRVCQISTHQLGMVRFLLL